MRTVMMLSMALLLPADLLAQKGSPKNPGAAAKIKALEQKKRELQEQESVHLKRIDAETKAAFENLNKHKIHLEKTMREQLEAEKIHTLKRIEERFAYVLKHDQPEKVWKELEHATQTLHAVHHHLEQANTDYGGRKGAAVKSLGAAVHLLRHRLTVHHWTAGEKQATVEKLQTAETDLNHALAYSAAKWGRGTPKRMPESQAKSDEQLTTSLTTIDNVKHLIVHAQWEEKVNAGWREQMKKHEAEELHKTRESYAAKLKAVDGEVSQNMERRKQELMQKKQQAISQTKARYQAEIKQIDDQIRLLQKK